MPGQVKVDNKDKREQMLKEIKGLVLARLSVVRNCWVTFFKIHHMSHLWIFCGNLSAYFLRYGKWSPCFSVQKIRGLDCSGCWLPIPGAVVCWLCGQGYWPGPCGATSQIDIQMCLECFFKWYFFSMAPIYPQLSS